MAESLSERRETLHLFLIFVAICLSALVAAGCQMQNDRKGPTETEGEEELPVPGARYFPLDTGNIWVYEIGDRAYRTDVRGVRKTDGIQYFVVWRRADWFGTEERLLRENEDGDIVEKCGGVERLWYKFSARPGESWVVGPVDADRNGGQVYLGILAVEREPVVVPAGVFKRCFRFFFDDPGSEGEEIAEWYAPDVGCVKRETQLGVAVLTIASLRGGSAAQ